MLYRFLWQINRDSVTEHWFDRDSTQIHLSIQIDKYLKQSNQFNADKEECGNVRWLSTTMPIVLAT